jgi:sugar phosphate isomerase/epimerase
VSRFAILRFAAGCGCLNLVVMSLLRCFSSLGCPELSLTETLALAARQNVPAVELRALGGTANLADYFAAKYGSPRQLAEMLQSMPTQIVAFDSSLKLIGSIATEREQFESLIPWAEALRVRWLRVFDGGKHADVAELEEAAKTVRWWRDLKRAHGWSIDMMVETHDSLVNSAALRRFIAAIPGTSILWDAHHTWRKGGEDPVTTWRAIRASVVHVHVKDSIAVPSARHPFTYVLPGDGEFPVASILSALRADNFKGPVSLEWEKMWHPYLPSLDEALVMAAKRSWW